MHSITRFSLIGLLVLSAVCLNSVKAAEVQGILLFEDLWPHIGDQDFNDEVIQYDISATPDSSGQFTELRATFNVLAIGSTLHNGLYLHLPTPSSSISGATVDLGNGPIKTGSVAGESDLVIPIVADTRSLFPSSSGFINTVSGQSSVQATAPIQLDVQFSSPENLDISQAPFDLFIARTGDISHQIHLPQYAGTDAMDVSLFNTGDDASTASRHFINAQGLPFALNIPFDPAHPGNPNLAVYPSEGTSIELAYPQLAEFAASGGTQATDWYNFPNPQYLYSPTPEPSAIILVAFGGLALVACRRSLLSA